MQKLPERGTAEEAVPARGREKAKLEEVRARIYPQASSRPAELGFSGGNDSGICLNVQVNMGV